MMRNVDLNPVGWDIVLGSHSTRFASPSLPSLLQDRTELHGYLTKKACSWSVLDVEEVILFALCRGNDASHQAVPRGMYIVLMLQEDILARDVLAQSGRGIMILE